MPVILTVLLSGKSGLVLLFPIGFDFVAVLFCIIQYNFFVPNSLTVITRRRAAFIKISVAFPSNIPRITNACVIVDTINAATFKKYAKKKENQKLLSNLCSLWLAFFKPFWPENGNGKFVSSRKQKNTNINNVHLRDFMLPRQACEVCTTQIWPFFLVWFFRFSNKKDSDPRWRNLK